MRVHIVLNIGGSEYEHTREVPDTYASMNDLGHAEKLLDDVAYTVKRAAGIA